MGFTPVTDPRTTDTQDRIRALAAFRTAGWDGAAAQPVRPDVIDAACRLVADLGADDPEPHCVPLVSGGVQLEWHVADRILELEVESADTVRYLKWWPGHDVGDAEASYPLADLDRSADLIRWVFTGDDVAP